MNYAYLDHLISPDTLWEMTAMAKNKMKLILLLSVKIFLTFNFAIIILQAKDIS